MGFAPLIGAGASILGGFLAGRGSNQKETKMQRTKRKLVDELLRSLSGGGQFSDIFSTDDETFQKSFVEPAKQRFASQIAPQIQQQYIAGGQQRSSGMEDQLLRAGVDLDSLLNEYQYKFQQDALNRKQNMINSILGQDAGAPQNPSTGQQIGSALSGYLGSSGFTEALKSLSGLGGSPQSTFGTSNFSAPPRKGFENDFMNWNLGDPRWG